jgi:hypothetical protein
VAGFAGEALRIAVTVAVGWDARFIGTLFLRRADFPFLAALAVAAGVNRAALATAIDRSRAVIAAALALDAFLIRVATAIVARPRLVVFADRPAARCAADRMVLIGIPVEQDLDKTIRAACIATLLATFALDAARLLWRTRVLALGSGFISSR